MEALSAALFLLGHPNQAVELLEGFRGGSGFLDINRERLEAYANAPDPDAVRALERGLFGSPATLPTSRAPPSAGPRVPRTSGGGLAPPRLGPCPSSRPGRVVRRGSDPQEKRVTTAAASPRALTARLL